MAPARIEVQVDELVLHGVATGDGAAVAEALRGELARLLAQSELRALPRAIATLDAGSFTARAGDGPDGIGVGVARAVHARLAPSREPTR